MKKRGLITTVAAALLGIGVAVCAFIPVSLVVDIDPDKATNFETLTKEDVRVYPSPFLTRGKPTNHFTFRKVEDKDTSMQSLLITSGLLSKDINLSGVSVKSITAHYDGIATEGEKIDPKKITATVTFMDDTTETVKDIEIFSAQDHVSRSDAVSIGTKYGITKLTYTFVQLTQLKAEYSAVAYEGDPFNQDSVKVYLQGEDDTTVDVDKLSVEGPTHFTGSSSYSIYTPYGMTTLDIEPVAIQSAVALGENYEGDTFGGKIELSYADGTVKEIESSDVQFSSEPIFQAGQGQVGFTWNGAACTLSYSAKPSNAIIRMEQTYQDDIAASTYNKLTDRTFVTIKKINADLPYIVTHVAIADPSQMQVYSANGQYGSGVELPDSAAQRTQWILGLNGSLFNTANGAAMTGCMIRNGQILVTGQTIGNEICITSGGALFSPPAGVGAQDLLAVGTVNMLGAGGPLLIQNGTALTEGATEVTGLLPRQAIGMVAPGEYYIITATDRGLTYLQLQSLFRDLGCSYARALDGGSSVSLYYGPVPVTENTARAVGDYLYITE